MKRVLDPVVAAAGLVVLSPVYAGIAVAVLVDSGRPVLFVSRRAGLEGRPFGMLKFRTMIPDAIAVGREQGITEDPFGIVKGDPRITRTGRWLRRTGLDELLALISEVIRAHLRSYDTVVRYGGDEFVCAMPNLGAAEARERWRAMRGRSAVLHSGHSLREVATGWVAAATGSTLVHFADVSDDEVEAYVATGEPLHVAGAFTIDGFGGAFVSGIEGDHHNVVGVSLPLLRELVLELGHAWPDLWT